MLQPSLVVTYWTGGASIAFDYRREAKRRGRAMSPASPYHWDVALKFAAFRGWGLLGDRGLPGVDCVGELRVDAGAQHFGFGSQVGQGGNRIRHGRELRDHAFAGLT